MGREGSVGAGVAGHAGRPAGRGPARGTPRARPPAARHRARRAAGRRPRWPPSAPRRRSGPGSACGRPRGRPARSRPPWRRCPRRTGPRSPGAARRRAPGPGRPRPRPSRQRRPLRRSRCSSASVRAQGVGVEQVAQRGTLAAAEQLGEQGRVERRARRRAARPGASRPRRGTARRSRTSGCGRTARASASRPRPAARPREPMSPHQLDQPGHVEDVLDALAHRLEDDRERGVLAGDLEQLGGPLALLPQGLTPVGPAPWQQQGARGALAEPRREQGRPADLAA